MADIMQVSDSNFEQEIVKSSIPALVDFWATWCVPCKALNPVIEEIAKRYEGRLKVTKMNVDDNSRTPAKYGIMGVPTLLLFKDGQILKSVTGKVDRSQVEKLVAIAF
jgi:thioredoxin 1